MAPDAGGDSLHVGLDGATPDGAANLTGFAPNAWTWSRLTMSNTNATLDLTAGGAYTLNVHMREDGLRLDKLLLITDTNTIPSGTGPAESPTTNVLPPLSDQTITYDYNPLYRLTEAAYTGAFSATYRYDYDAVGNRQTYTTTMTTTEVTTYQYDAANRLVESAVQGGDTTTYDWDNASRLITTTVAGNVSRVYSYSQDGDLLAAVVEGVTTTFAYDGDGHRLQMNADGNITTYTLDYAAGFQVLLEQGGAFAGTKHYLYGLACIGEHVNADEPETEEWRYYQRDGNSLVRQTTNAQADITLTWTFSPEGAVVLGEEGPVTNLDCGDGAIYDWSTGLIFKNGRYFDPNTGIWITFGGLVIWQAWRPGSKKGRGRKSRKRLILFSLFLLLILTLLGCGPGPAPMVTPCPTPTNIPVPGIPSNTPTTQPTNTLSPTAMNTPTGTPIPPATNTPVPTPTLTPTPTQNGRIMISLEEWEKKLMSVVTFFEMEGQGLPQAEAISWIILNRYADPRFKTISGYSSRMESLLLGDPNQFQVTVGVFRHWTEQGITGAERATKAFEFYSTDPDYNGQELLRVRFTVDQVIDAYNNGKPDPTLGAIYYMHVDPGTESNRIAGLQAEAESEGRLNELTTGVILGQSPWLPKVLVYNNLYSPPYPIR